MKSFIRQLQEDEPESNIIYIDLLLHDNECLRDKESLYRKILDSYDKDKKNYLFIDEVQL